MAGFANCCGMKKRSGSVAISSSALPIAPRMPSAPGVSTRFAPNAASTFRRSRLIVSGMVSVSLKPRDAHTKAQLQEISDVLTPGTSAIVALVEQQWIAEVENRLAQAGAKIARTAIAADVADQIEADRAA